MSPSWTPNRRNVPCGHLERSNVGGSREIERAGLGPARIHVEDLADRPPAIVEGDRKRDRRASHDERSRRRAIKEKDHAGVRCKARPAHQSSLPFGGTVRHLNGHRGDPVAVEDYRGASMCSLCAPQPAMRIDSAQTRSSLHTTPSSQRPRLPAALAGRPDRSFRPEGLSPHPQRAFRFVREAPARFPGLGSKTGGGYGHLSAQS